jgi:hypothetical protein
VANPVELCSTDSRGRLSPQEEQTKRPGFRQGVV